MNCRRLAILIVTALVFDLSVLPHFVIAQDDPVELGQRALDSGIDYPWYDPATDRARQVDVKRAKPPAVAKKWEKWPLEAGAERDWGDWSEYFAEILEVLAWILVGAVLIWGLWYLFRSLLLREQALAQDHAVTDYEQSTRVTQLPFPVPIRDPQADFLAEARRHYDAGSYGEAAVYLFSYQLLQLDRHGWIRLMKGKTNRQYVRELQGAVPLSQLLTGSMLVFEDFFFGNHPVEKDRFESLWQRMDDFQHAIVATESPD